MTHGCQFSITTEIFPLQRSRV